MNAEFNRMTITAAAEVISAEKSHDEMAVLEVEWGIQEYCNSSSKAGRVASWSRLANDENFEVITPGGQVSLARAMIGTAIGVAERYQEGQNWGKLIAGLRLDGFERVESESGVSLKRMLPEDVPGVDFREAESEIEALLDRVGFTIARGHLNLDLLHHFPRSDPGSATARSPGCIEVGAPGCPGAPSQIPACGFPAPGSSRELAWHSCQMVWSGRSWGGLVMP